MSNHVIKYEYKDGKKLGAPELWCGRKPKVFGWHFTSAQHVALFDGFIKPCKNCIKSIIKSLEQKNDS